MSRRFLYLSLLSTAITGCSVSPTNGALGSFDYTEVEEGKALVIPSHLAKPKQGTKFQIAPVNTDGPVGKKMDVRSPSLVLPIAASSRLEPSASDAIIWFDQVLDDKELYAFILEALKEQLLVDDVELITLDEQAKKFQSTWFHKETEDGFWYFSEVSEVESVKFNYTFEVKPHGRSVSVKVEVAGFMKTDEQGSTDKIGAIDKQRAEMNMLNNIIAQVDYKYRIYQHENRLMRANQKLVTIGENSKSEPSYIVEMELDPLWANMPNFFDNYGFKVTDLNEPKKIYYVDFVQPSNSIWASLWGDEVPVLELEDAAYQVKLKERGDDGEQTEVTIYDADGQPLPAATLELIFPVIEPGLSFRNVY